jgi:hypothetical protein
MARMKRVPKTQLDKAREQMKSKPKVKITGSASTPPRVSSSMIKSQPKTTTGKTTPMPKIIGAKPGVKKNLPKIEGAKPSVKKPMPKILGPIKPIVRKPVPSSVKRSPTKKSGVVVALPNGSTVGIRDIGKVKPTPKPKPKPSVIKPKEYTPAQYDALLRKAQRDAQKKR